MEVPTAILESFVEGSKNSSFPIYNLPYGIFLHEGKTYAGTAIGDFVLNLTILEEVGLLQCEMKLFNTDSLNLFASKGPKIWSFVRRRIQALLSVDNYELQHNETLLKQTLIPMSEVAMKLPFKIGGFSDFYASEHHASNVGRLFRGPENALLPNWKYIPVGYNGRASTVFASGTDIIRPKGQLKLMNSEEPIFAATKKLDFELEIGFFIGVGNPEGHPIAISDASSHIFGLVLLNDWSARDIQAFEYQPLGPFLSKSFATSISHWVVPFEALQQVMVSLPTQIPQPVNYLYQKMPMQPDIKLKVELKPSGSKEKTLLCETNCKELYWSMEQMLAHHTVNHCIMKPGDLLGTGTISGAKKENWGSLLEISFNGKEPIKLKEGGERSFLEDGDTVIFTGYCQLGEYKLGFGSLEGTVRPNSSNDCSNL